MPARVVEIDAACNCCVVSANVSLCDRVGYSFGRDEAAADMRAFGKPIPWGGKSDLGGPTAFAVGRPRREIRMVGDQIGPGDIFEPA
jgi:hypothetical protein